MNRLAHIVLLPDGQHEALQTWWLTEDGLMPSETLADDAASLPVIARVAP